MQNIDRLNLTEYPKQWHPVATFCVDWRLADGHSAGCFAFHRKETPKMLGTNGEYEWHVCRTCQKFSLAVNEYGICGRCSDNDRAPSPIMFASIMHHVAPISGKGTVLSESHWRRIVQQVNDFYRYIPESHRNLWNTSTQGLKVRHRASDPKEGYIYLIEAETGYFKVGRSYDVETRLGQHMMDYPMKMKVIHSFQSSNVKHDEKRLLKAFKSKQLRGEWFELDGYDVAWFKSIEDFSLSGAFMKFKNRRQTYTPENPRPENKRIWGIREQIGKLARVLRGIRG